MPTENERAAKACRAVAEKDARIIARFTAASMRRPGGTYALRFVRDETFQVRVSLH